MWKNHLGKTPEAQETEAKLNKWDYVKLSSYCVASNQQRKDTNRMKNQMFINQLSN